MNITKFILLASSKNDNKHIWTRKNKQSTNQFNFIDFGIKSFLSRTATALSKTYLMLIALVIYPSLFLSID